MSRSHSAFSRGPRATMVSRLLLFFALVLLTVHRSNATVGLIHSLIRNNLAGTPDNFVTQPWVFDPEVAKAWSKEYQQLNGIRGEALIERVGLGEDGLTEERRLQQAERDRGVYVSRQPLHGP